MDRNLRNRAPYVNHRDRFLHVRKILLEIMSDTGMIPRS